jgi:hypothetical protein
VAQRLTNAEPALQPRHRAHLDQKLLPHQPVDHQQRVGRIGAAGEQARELARAILHEFRNVLRVHQIGGEVDDVGEACALRGERDAEIGKDLGALCVEVGGRPAVAVSADLAGDEQELRRFDARDVRILPERLAEAVGVEHLNAGHRALRNDRCGGVAE